MAKVEPTFTVTILTMKGNITAKTALTRADIKAALYEGFDEWIELDSLDAENDHVHVKFKREIFVGAIITTWRPAKQIATPQQTLVQTT